MTPPPAELHPPGSQGPTKVGNKNPICAMFLPLQNAHAALPQSGAPHSHSPHACARLMRRLPDGRTVNFSSGHRRSCTWTHTTDSGRTGPGVWNMGTNWQCQFRPWAGHAVVSGCQFGPSPPTQWPVVASLDLRPNISTYMAQNWRENQHRVVRLAAKTSWTTMKGVGCDVQRHSEVF
jgi:hypothetical protein